MLDYRAVQGRHDIERFLLRNVCKTHQQSLTRIMFDGLTRKGMRHQAMPEGTIGEVNVGSMAEKAGKDVQAPSLQDNLRVVPELLVQRIGKSLAPGAIMNPHPPKVSCKMSFGHKCGNYGLLKNRAAAVQCSASPLR